MRCIISAATPTGGHLQSPARVTGRQQRDFRWRDSAIRTAAPDDSPAEEFLRRFLLHMLPQLRPDPALRIFAHRRRRSLLPLSANCWPPLQPDAPSRTPSSPVDVPHCGGPMR